MHARTRSHDDYTVGWICALPVETAAAKLMLDKIHPPLPRLPMDQNTYIFGSIGEHNIVIASLPTGAYGNTSAATVGTQLLSSFHAIRFGLMVGIGGGVPSSSADIRLGDIVVSQPTDTSGGVVQYDLGKALSGGQSMRTGMLNRPPKVLLTALATLQAHHLTEDSRIVRFVSNLQAKLVPSKATKFMRPTQKDCLFQAEYDHIAYNTCINCDRSKLVLRPPREHQEPVIHYGLIGSANQVIKDGRRREQLARDLGIYCVEMEAAGLMNDFPCLVIRGICDYADSHKNKEWQGYAAAVAAAYAKELLLIVAIDQINCTPSVQHTLANSVHRFDVPLNLTDVPVIANFVGRQGELDQLWQYLRPTDSQSQKVAVIHGLGGIGKTQLAVRFARDHKYDFTAIFWLNGKDRDTLVQSLGSILPQLPSQSYLDEAMNDEEVEERARYVLKWLAMKGNQHWLIIFDNIDQYAPLSGHNSVEYDIAEFFPGADHGSIIITSRLQRLSELGKSFPVHRLDSKDSIQLLLQSSHLSVRNITVKDIESDPDVVALTNRLDGLPLALVIAGAFMRETGSSIAEYLQYYQESWSELQSQSYPGRQYQQGNILQTWMISYREVQKRDMSAASLLLFFACFDNRDLWYGLVKSGCHSSYVPACLKRVISSELKFKIAVQALIGFSLLEAKQQDGSYTMHPVLQAWCLHLVTTCRDLASTRFNELALISVGYSVPSSYSKNYSELQQRLIPHANYVRYRNLTDDNIAIWGALHDLGRLYYDQGKLNESEEMYQQALVGKQKNLGPEHTSTLDTVHKLGTLYSDQGRFNEAEEMYQRALSGRKKVLGLRDASTYETVNNLGVLYKDQGKFKKAEEMYQWALEGYEKTLDPFHPSALNPVNNLGFLYYQQGRLKEAEEMYQRALEGYEKTLGPDHPSTLNPVNNLGLLYSQQGRLKEAEEMYQRALEGYEKTLGPDHPSTLNPVNNLGLLYSQQGRLKEAEEMYQRALEGYEKALGPDHPSTLNPVNNLGLLYYQQEKLEEAEMMYQFCLAGKKRILGQDHISTLDTVYNLGLLYFQQGKLEEAEKMYQQALEGYEKSLGLYHRSTLTTVNNLGLLYSEQGKLKEAEEMYHRALAGKERVLGLDQISTLTTVHNLGNLYENQGRLMEAGEMFQRAMLGYGETLGPDHRRTRRLAQRLNTLSNAEIK
ncbi:uncharacterized protein N7469_001999 [Penicillium citrinum]|uniref:Uncharacterized protein n=1 Tax=Penicillium citrinum TaxID=5077 RepID=A0A9W9P9M3_PENCI|nr:uncharacterized protein N7469_001999 [Penicillium citrinum]KAJ5240408.1 hypothetical protein N7469_001999 [Penicillium citrinum]